MNPALVGGSLFVCLLLAGAGVFAAVRRTLPQALADDGDPDDAERDSFLSRALAAAAARAGRVALRTTTATGRAAITRRLGAAGDPGGLTLERYLGMRAVVIVMFGAAGITFWAGGAPVTGVVLIVAGAGVPGAWLRSEARGRQAELERQLPGFIDVVAVAVGAEVPVKEALTAAARVRGGVVGEEVGRVLAEVELGVGLADALAGMRARNPSAFVSSAVGALIDTLTLGSRLVPALSTIAAETRQAHHEAQLARAARLAPRIAVITATLLVPGALILIVSALLAGAGFAFDGWVAP